MSLGYSVGDCLAVAQLAWKVYKSCRDAPESFSNIQFEVLSLHAVLKEVEETFLDQELAASRAERLAAISAGCKGVLNDLQAVIEKYKSLGSKSQRTWDRMRWGSVEVAELRARLTSNTMLLTAFMSTSQVTVEKQLKKLIQEFQEGKHEGSVMTVATVESISMDDKQTWRLIRKEFEDIGISVAAFDANKDFIMNWFHQALENGAFGEQQLEDGESDSEMHDTIHEADRRGSTNSEQMQSLRSHTSTIGESEDSGHGQYEETEAGAAKDNTPELAESVLPQRSLLRVVASAQQPHVIPGPPLFNMMGLPPSTRSQNIPRKAVQGKREVPQVSRSSEKRPPIIAALISRIFSYERKFHQSCWQGDLPGAQQMLDKGVNINCVYQSETVIDQAVQYWDKDTVHFLLSAGAKLNDNTDFIFDQLKYVVGCRKYGSSEIQIKRRVKLLEYLLQLGAEKQYFQSGINNLWTHSMTNTNFDIAEVLLRYGISVVTQDGQYNKYLETAMLKGSRKMVQCLLDLGASPNSITSINISVLSYACRQGQYDTVVLLIDRGAEVTAENASKFLLSAIKTMYDTKGTKEFEIFELLVSTFPGLVEEVPLDLQQSPLICAIRNHRFDYAEILVAGGANLSRLYGAHKAETSFFLYEAAWENLYLRLLVKPLEHPPATIECLSRDFGPL